LEDIHQLDKQIIEDINAKMGFSLNYVPISTIFQKKYLKNKPTLYKNKTTNTAKLDILQEQIEAYLTYINN
jgi:hypothetical protein